MSDHVRDQNDHLGHIEAMLRSPDEHVVLQGCELLAALGDPELIAFVADGCAIDDAGALAHGEWVEAWVGSEPRRWNDRAWRPWVALRLVDALIGVGGHPEPHRFGLAYTPLGPAAHQRNRPWRDPPSPQLFDALVHAEHIWALSDLDLRYTGLDDGAVAALAGAPILRGLGALHLQGNAIGPDGARALARSPHLRDLTALDLRANPIGADGLAALLGSPLLGPSTLLRVDPADVGADGARALATAAGLRPDLRALWRARLGRVA